MPAVPDRVRFFDACLCAWLLVGLLARLPVEFFCCLLVGCFDWFVVLICFLSLTWFVVRGIGLELVSAFLCSLAYSYVYMYVFCLFWGFVCVLLAFRVWV